METRANTGFAPPGATETGDRARRSADQFTSPGLERVSVTAFLLFWGAWMALLGFIWTRHPGLDHGDAFTDACVLSAGRNFDRQGIRSNWGLPRLDTYVDPAKPNPPYTHYPPGPWWIHQLLKTVGLRRLWQFRTASVAVTAASALLLMLVMARLAGSRFVGALAAFFYMWSAPFSGYADSIYQFAYAQVTLFGFMGAWLAFEASQTRRRRRLWLALALVLFFIDGWITFEHAMLVALFVTWRTLRCRRRALVPGCLAVILLPPVVLALRLGHNAAVLGSVKSAVNDMVSAVQRRAGDADASASVGRPAGTWAARLGAGSMAPSDREAEFRYPVLQPAVIGPAFFLAVLALVARRVAALRPVRQATAEALLLVVGGAAWLVVMKQHAIVHRHVIMLLLPGLSLLLGCLTSCGVLLFVDRRRGTPLLRWIGLICAVIVTLSFLVSMRSSIALNQIATLHPDVRADVLTRREYFRRIKQATAALSDVRRLAVYGLYPQAAYLLGRPFEFVETVPLDLGPDEALWVTPATAYEQRAAVEALKRYGFPDLLSSPADLRMIFRGRGTQDQAVNVRFADAVRMTNLRFATSLDGDSWIAQFRFAGRMDEATCRDLLVFCHVLGAAGNAATKVDWPLTVAIRDQTTAATAHVIPRADVPAGARLVIGLWSLGAGGPLPIVGENTLLPGGARLSSDQGYFVWTPEPWR